MNKVLLIKNDMGDYGAIAFEESNLSLNEVYKLVESGQESFEDGEFGAQILEFACEMTQADVDMINALLDTHNEKVFIVVVNE